MAYAGKYAFGDGYLRYIKIENDFYCGRSVGTVYDAPFVISDMSELKNKSVMVICENVKEVDCLSLCIYSHAKIYSMSSVFRGYFDKKCSVYVPENLVDYYKSRSYYAVNTYDFDKDPNNVLTQL